jgi:hypothetical protein
VNHGTVANNSSPYTTFTLQVGGDLANAGSWTNLNPRGSGPIT